MEEEIFGCPFKKRKIELVHDDQDNSIATDENIISNSDENKLESVNDPAEEDEVEIEGDSGEGHYTFQPPLNDEILMILSTAMNLIAKLIKNYLIFDMPKNNIF